MARLQLSKASLSREQGDLGSYRRFLPSLDLKRQQLMAERAKATKGLQATREEFEATVKAVGEKLPMLADRDIDLTDFATVSDVTLGSENLMGTHLPTLENIQVDIRPYSLMGKPHWVDNLAEALHQVLTLRVRAEVEEHRLALLDAAVATTTQRVNLFDKVLIPRARANIKRIQIYLSDAQTAAVVRSKIAKRKHAVSGTA